MNIPKFIIFLLLIYNLTFAAPLTLPLDQRPQWLKEEGIIMAGSWEPLMFRVRRDGSSEYKATLEQKTAYDYEHSREMTEKLKALGVNFVMMHAYKDMGLTAEQQSMEDAAIFSGLCRENGIHTGVYCGSGTLLWEIFYKEEPHAKNWLLLDKDANPLPYGKATYRYRWNRNHPDGQTYYHKVVKKIIEDIKPDLLHFDNYVTGPGYDEYSKTMFRRYLTDNFDAAKLNRFGIQNVDNVEPPKSVIAENILTRLWLDFSCQALTDSYYDISRYARSLDSSVLIECNPSGIYETFVVPRDHGRLLAGGEAYWDETRENQAGYLDGQIRSRIRSYKVARKMNNMLFSYTNTPLKLAESMAFNLDCLGAICWFEYGRIVKRPGSDEPLDANVLAYVNFFREHRYLFSNTKVVADAAVLRNFASMEFTNFKSRLLPYKVEQALIESRIPFQIIFNQHLNDLSQYKTLVLAGCSALSDRQIDQIKQYVKGGGKLCVIGPAASHDEWMFPREKPGIEEIPESAIVSISDNGDYIKAIRQACENKLSASIEAEQGLCAEFTEQPGRLLLHLVNYRGPNNPAKNIKISLCSAGFGKVEKISLVSPEHKNNIELPFRQKDGTVTFTVPKVATYEIAVVESDNGCSENLK
jgi:hypothetical protein